MKRVILLMFFGLVAIGVSAQKVYKADADGTPNTSGSIYVIDCEGMPEGSYTKTAKARTTTATSSTAVLIDDLTDIASAESNKKVAYKFEVQGSDESRNSDWSSAIASCAGKAGGNWRLPTQRELMLIWIMHEGLKKLSGFSSFVTYYYWSATEDSSTYSWNVGFTKGLADGHTYDLVKTGDNRLVRCVRDITTP